MGEVYMRCLLRCNSVRYHVFFSLMIALMAYYKSITLKVKVHHFSTKNISVCYPFQESSFENPLSGYGGGVGGSSWVCLSGQSPFPRLWGSFDGPTVSSLSDSAMEDISHTKNQVYLNLKLGLRPLSFTASVMPKIFICQYSNSCRKL